MEQDTLLASSQQAKLPLALFTFESNKKKQLLFDPSTKKIRRIISAAFADATCVFENGGWLLMLQHKQHGFQEQQEQTIFLVHANTGRRLELPACPSVIDGLFVFYVGSSEVPLVVVCIETISGVPTVHVACPGDIYWSVYKNTEDGSHLRLDPHRRIKCTLIIDVVLLGKQAVCVDYHGKILIFDVTEMSWRRTALSKG
uniref:KIB1-4 beta-propeller domain-containing protein n=2 Tax=Aegilops tauschii TaxID=37682 RepID=A0A453SP30_AEGTS